MTIELVDQPLNRDQRRQTAHQERGKRSKHEFPRRLRRREASEYLDEVHGVGVAANTLAKMACQGGGPIFYKFGRFPVYELDDLDAWARQKLGQPMRSTSEVAMAGANR